MDKHWWQQISWRQVQTNLREIDMLDINAEEYVNELEKFDATVAMINVGGILASYPTELPYHTQSEWLKGDSLIKVINTCHAAGIHVIARTDFSKIRKPIYEQHPDWAYRTKDGSIVDYNGDVHACICGGFQQECALNIIREICHKLPIDGLFINMGGFQVRDYSYNEYGLCHCTNCKRLFKERYGMELPEKEDMSDPTYRAYKRFQRDITHDQMSRIIALCRNENPEIAINGIDFLRMESNTEYGRPLPHWQYSGASNTRCLRGVRGDVVVSNTSVDFIGFFYRHVGVGPSQQALRIWQAIANLGCPDYYLIGRLDNHHDRSSYKSLQEAFHFHKMHEDDYANMRSVADVLVLRQNAWSASLSERGWIRALTESHMLFDEATVDDALKHGISAYKAIILSGIKILPVKFVEMIQQYAKDGGIVIGEALSNIYDGEYEPYGVFPLSKLFGIESILCRREDMRSAMFEVLQEENEIFKTFAENDCDVIAFGDSYQFCSYDINTNKYMSLIPPQMYGPPERCYTYERTLYPAVVTNNYGNGKGIWIPCAIAGLFASEGYLNTYWFLKDILENVAGINSLSKCLSPMIEVTLSEERSGKHGLVQLVNNTGCFSTTYYEPVPVCIDVLDVPCKRQVCSAYSLINGRNVHFVQDNGIVKLNVGEIGKFESIKLIF